MNDHQCPSSQKCCPNKCGSVSCVEASPVYTGSNGAGYRAVVRGILLFIYFFSVLIISHLS